MDTYSENLARLTDPSPFIRLMVGVLAVYFAVSAIALWFHRRQLPYAMAGAGLLGWMGLTGVFANQMTTVHPIATSLLVSSIGVALGAAVLIAALPWSASPGTSSAKLPYARILVLSVAATIVTPAAMLFVALITGVDSF